ncbi:hypothetical protein [Marinagarivorans algicola]|uniref:hypothetical protein n=1 Tax=Marinagarivorans algicola TaxID=1513270 RepID=UPI0006B4CCD4|nr:hypothetical protein [Marinagarivorans algicola]
MTQPYAEYKSPDGAPNVRFISAKVREQAALAQYSQALTRLFNLSVKMLLLSKNTAITQQADTQIGVALKETQQVCEQLCICSQVAKGVHTSGNLFRYLTYLLTKAETTPAIEVFYEIASLSEVLAEGFNAARVS